MTHDEAEKVWEVCLEADGGCPHCARELRSLLIEAFPMHDWVAISSKGRWDD